MTPSSHRSSSRAIRASDIGQWSYCQRAWWLAEQGYDNENSAALQIGSQAHEQHARQVAVAHRSRTLARWLVLLGLLILVAVVLASALSLL